MTKNAPATGGNPMTRAGDGADEPRTMMHPNDNGGSMTQATAAPPEAPTNRLRLYDIPDAYREVEEAMIENGGEITPEQEQYLDHLADEFERKAEYIALLSREAKAEAEAVRQEEERLKARRVAAENRERRLKDYLHASMTKAGIERVEGDRIKVRTQRNSSPSLTWTKPPEEAPDAYRRTTVTVDLRAAAQELRSGADLPDGFLVEWGSHVRVW